MKLNFLSNARAGTYACRIIYDLMDLVEIVGLVNLPT